MRWRDISEWQPGERRDNPNRLSLEGYAMRVAIRRDSTGAWWVHCFGLDLNWPLGVMNVKTAKMEALAKVQQRLEQMMTDLNQMKSAT